LVLYLGKRHPQNPKTPIDHKEDRIIAMFSSITKTPAPAPAAEKYGTIYV
jgi:hypothetical protein